MGYNLMIIKELKLYSLVVILILTVEGLISEKECPREFGAFREKELFKVDTIAWRCNVIIGYLVIYQLLHITWLETTRHLRFSFYPLVLQYCSILVCWDFFQ